VNRFLHIRLVKVNIGKYQFNPGILPSVLTLCLLYIMISMGLWQLDRAAFKQDQQHKIEQRRNLPPVSLEELPVKQEDAVYYPVRLRGHFDLQHQFLLDNRVFKQMPGYHVYTPLIMSDGRAILVNRGWVAQGRTRQDLPELPAPKDVVEFTGLMDKSPAKGVILMAHANDSQQWPRVLQYIDMQEISELTGHKMYPMVVWMDEDTDYGFDYQLPVMSLNSAKNTGYAFQWFSMSIALTIIYIVVNTKKIK
jgi:surfeit locus 1 family protein